MLTGTPQSLGEWAWLSDGCERRAMRVQKLSSQPKSRGLSFFAPDFAQSFEAPWLWGEEREWPELSLSRALLPKVVLRREPSRADFEQLCGQVLERIRLGQFQKVVPMISERFQFSEPLSASMFSTAFTPSENEFAYGFQFQGEGLIGVTPELLFEVKDGILTTMALAGTAPMDGPSLLEIPKERGEHNLVVENLESALKSFGSVEIGETVERAFRRLKHLFTPIRVVLNREPEFQDLVSALHPTAALGGWPRAAALDWLRQQPFHLERRRFGAPFGFADGDHMICVVAIRGLQWSGAEALVSAGCGVVERSEPAREWSELQLKLSALKANLGLPL